MAPLFRLSGVREDTKDTDSNVTSEAFSNFVFKIKKLGKQEHLIVRNRDGEIILLQLW
jgi:hypothetical protein